VNVVVGFSKKMNVEQASMMALSFASLAALAPAVLRLGTVSESLWRVAALGAIATITTSIVTALRVRRHRYTLRTLALGGSAVEPSDVEGLRTMPNTAVASHLLIGFIASLALAFPGIRPVELGAEVARELALLGVMTSLATSIPAFVLFQAGVARLLEASPLQPVTDQLETLAERNIPQRSSRQNWVFAVAVPVALVGVGGALASYAHLRAITNHSRQATAVALGRGVVGAGETRRSAGQKAAIETAEKLGYEVEIRDSSSEDPTPGKVTRTADDRLAIELPLAEGSVGVRYASELGASASAPLFLVAIFFALLAVLAAQAMARLLAGDLSRVALRLRTLGTEEVLHGEEGAPRFEGRFHAVGELFDAALALADRFRVFAAAQERALEARENARRARGLLFASVSHDLKSPLNAILGFADSIDRLELGASQCESLDLISTRGRELVALIETILDAARIEAGQLELDQRRLGVAAWLANAAKLARELGLESGDLRVEVGEDLPLTDVDPVYLPRALAVIIAHALRAPTIEGGSATVTVRASQLAGEDRVRIEIDHGATSITAGELSALFDRKTSSRGRGLSLGLSIARTIFERHGGAIEVHGDPQGAPLVLAFVPAATSSPRKPHEH
jgi:signal transduction histidine kinase